MADRMISTTHDAKVINKTPQRTMPIQFNDVPPEIIHYILLHLDVPDLLNTSRTSHLLRQLSLDPLLHAHRRRLASSTLSHRLGIRPSKASISPPNAWICLNKTNVLSRSISRSLVRIRLSHSLERRPDVGDLVDRAILPIECCRRLRTSSHRDEKEAAAVGDGVYHVSPVIVRKQEQVRKSLLKSRLGRKLAHRPDVQRVVELGIIPAECVGFDADGRRRWGAGVGPGLVEMRRKVIKENLKDGLRAWVQRKGWREQQRREGEWEEESVDVRTVKTLVRRLSARVGRELHEDTSVTHLDRLTLEKRKAQARWGRDVEETRKRTERRKAMLGYDHSIDINQPTRAHVLGLRRFWEGVIKAAAG